jgi:uncharacterized protein (DUF2147 family)
MKHATSSSLFLIVLLTFFTNGFAQTSSMVSDNILGIYWSPKKNAKIEFYKKGNVYFGKTIWVSNPKKDTENPNSQLRKRDLVGLDLLTNFIYDNGNYSGGQVYDPENGKTYSCKITCNGQNLKVRGYIGISLLGRTETFERIL